MRRKTEKNHFQIDKNLHFMNMETRGHTPQQKAPAQTKPKKSGVNCVARVRNTRLNGEHDNLS